MHSSAHNDICFVLSVFSGACSGTRSSSNGVYSMTYAVNGNAIRFTVQALTTGWVGIGFSLDQLMVSNFRIIQWNVFRKAILNFSPYTCSLCQMWLLVQPILKVLLCMMGEFGTVMAAEWAAYCDTSAVLAEDTVTPN